MPSQYASLHSHKELYYNVSLANCQTVGFGLI